MSLRSAGNTGAAKICSGALETAPTRALRLRKAWAARNNTAGEVLSLFIEPHLTNSMYKNSRSNKNKELHIYPVFLVIKAAKEECCPYKDTILFQEYLAEINLQAFLNKKVLKSIRTLIL